MPSHTDALYDVVNHIAVGNLEGAQRDLDELLAAVDTEADPSAVRYYVFGGAIANRLSKDSLEKANLYLNDYEVPQIYLFNLLANRVPIVSLTTILANETMLRHAEGREELHLMDVGIGTGRQIVTLLEQMQARGSAPSKVHVVGIEPADWSLELARKNVLEAADKLGISCTFEPICNVAENMTQREWETLAANLDRPIINASFALHHIRDIDNEDVRTQVLARLRTLDPSVLILCEPNSNHLERDYIERFRNCFSHFSTVFKVIDRLDISQEDGDALKIQFFGREINDILGNPVEDRRTERHERTTSWVQRLADSGFAPAAEMPIPAKVGHDVVDVHVNEHGYYSLDFGGETMVSVLVAEPGSLPDDFAPFATTGKLAEDERPSAPRLLAPAYLSALVAIARADKLIHERERAYIETQARLLGVNLEELWAAPSLEQVLEEHDLDTATREAILRDTIVLSHIDGEVSADEREAIAEVAATLGVSAARHEAIAVSAKDAIPRGLEGAPAWFKEQWFLANK